MTEECDRCGREFEQLQTVELQTEHSLCDGCVRAIDEDVHYYDWQDRYTEEQHERAVSLLSEQDEIECVISSYEDGQIIVHTPYVSSDVVADFINHFGFEIVTFGPQWEVDDVWPCMTTHGDIFEIMLEYNSRSRAPVPTTVKFFPNYIDNLDKNDKQF